jgi:hypothetical protein
MLNYCEVNYFLFKNYFINALLGDPPIKAIEFNGYMVLKSTLDGDRIPICRVEDLEITLISPDFPARVRLPTKSEHIWRSLSEVRAAEVQCMQLALALLARHESEMYVSTEAEKTTKNYLQTTYNQEERSHKSGPPSDAIKKHIEECEKVFGTNNHNNTKTRSTIDIDSRSSSSAEQQLRNLTLPTNNTPKHHSTQHHGSSLASKSDSTRMTTHSSHAASDKLYRTLDRKRATDNEHTEQSDSYNHSHRPTIRKASIPPSSNSHKTKMDTN